MLTDKDFIDNGYKRFTQQFLNKADYGLQKLIKDDKGKRYYITVYAFDFTKHGFGFTQKIGYQPEVQFKTQDGIYLQVSMILHKDSTVEQIELHYRSLFDKMQIEYYELWSE
jgi:hypothetical protein